jgi:hypothetical protein
LKIENVAENLKSSVWKKQYETDNDSILIFFLGETKTFKMLPDISLLREMETFFFEQFDSFLQESDDQVRKIVQVEIVGIKSFLKSTGKIIVRQHSTVLQSLL